MVQSKSLYRVRRCYPSPVNEAATNPESKPSRFSFGWCVTAALLHFAATFAIAGISFVVGMGAFTTSTYEAQHIAGQISFWRGVQWVWTPLAMAAWDPQQSLNIGLLVGLAFIWSCIMGGVSGLFGPVFRRWIHKPLYPSATINDNSRNASSEAGNPRH
jgi:hypothetical protein